MRGGEPGIPKATWPPIYFDEFDRVTQAAGLVALRAAPASEGREVRIWIGGGIGYPQSLYRFVATGGEVRGEQILYWPAYPPDTSAGERPGEAFHDIIVHSQRGRCDGFRVAAHMGVCRTRFVRMPDWRTILARAEQAGLWNLPDESALPGGHMILDGWGLTVELRENASYRTYHYGNPDAQDWPEARQAVAITAALRAVDSLARRPDGLKLYRGTTSGRQDSEFRPCGGGPSWEFQGDLRWAVRRDSTLMAVDTTDATREYYVEVLGQLAPEWLVRRWKSAYPQVLQVRQVRRIAPWTGAEC